MGTSVSQASPRTTGWRVVAAGYQTEHLPPTRIATEIWRAATGPGNNLGEQLEAPGVFHCYRVAQDFSGTPQRAFEALARIGRLKDNTIALEFAKRATLIACQKEGGAQQWASLFFKEITNYLVARDASGYVGQVFRSKDVGELSNLKAEISSHVEKRVQDLGISAESAAEWQRKIKRAIETVKGVGS